MSELFGSEIKPWDEKKCSEGENVLLGQNGLGRKGEASWEEPAVPQNNSVPPQWIFLQYQQ